MKKKSSTLSRTWNSCNVFLTFPGELYKNMGEISYENKAQNVDEKNTLCIYLDLRSRADSLLLSTNNCFKSF